MNFSDGPLDKEQITSWLIEQIDWYINDSPNSAVFRNNLRSSGSTIADNDELLKKYMLEMFEVGELKMLYNPLDDMYCFTVKTDSGLWKEI